MIRITWEKNIFFQKGTTQYILIHNPLNMYKQSWVKKKDIKKSILVKLTWQTCSPDDQGWANPRYHVKVAAQIMIME